MARYTIDFSTNASAVVREIEKVNAAILKVAREGKSISIKLDTSGLKSQLDTTFSQLNRQIEQMQAKLSRLQIGSQPFNKLASNIGFRQGQLERGQMIAQPLMLRGQAQSFDEGSAVRLQKELQAAQIQASQIRPASEPWVRLQGEIARINGELQRADRLAENIKLTNDLGAFAPGSLNRLEAQLTLLRNRAREISPDTAEWKALNKEIVKAEQGIEKQTRKPLGTGQRLGAAGGAFLYGGGLGGGIGSAVGGIAGGLLGGVPGAFTGAALGQATDGLVKFAGGIAQTAAEVRKSQIALAGVVRDVNDYNAALQATTEASRLFLLPIDQATKQFTKLQASVAGAGFQTADTKQVFNGIAAAIVATGGSAEDLNGALTATSQVFSKGKVTAEELRGQIGERLPGAFQIFATATGRSTQQLDDALQKGEVGLADFLKFTQELTKRYAETAKTLGEAPENAGARLQVALTAASVAYGGFFQKVGAGFQDYATSLLEFALNNEKQFKTFVATVTVAAQDFYRIFSGVIDALGPLFQNFFKYIFDNFGRGLNALATLASESRRAAGGPEKRAAAMVDELYKGRPLEGYFGGRSKAFQEALRVELAYEKKQDQFAKDRQSRIDDLVKGWMGPAKPPKFGQGLGKTPPGGLTGEGAGGGASKRERQLRDFQSEAIAQLRLNEKLAQQKLDQQRQLELIDDTEYEIASANNKRKFELLVIDEALAQKAAEIGEYKADVREKQLAVFQQLAENERTLVNQEADTAIKGARLKLSRPFKDAIRDENIEIEKQAMLIDNLKQGYGELTPEQQANLIIEEKIKDLKSQQQAIIKTEIDNLRQVTLERIRGAQALARETELLRLRNQAAQLRAPLGQERLVELLQTPGVTPEQAQEQFTIEQQNQRLQTLRQAATDLAGTVNSSLGNALTGIATDFQNIQQYGTELLKALGDGFKQLANTIIQEATRALINSAVSKLFGFLAPAIGSFAGGAGFGSQTALPTGVGIGAGNGIIQNAAAQGFGTLGPNFGFRQFATGGVVTGPTLGLVGEGRFNEAVVPLPNGKSIPVDLGNGAGNNISTNIVVNVSNGQASSQVTGGGGQALGRELEGAVRSVILREARPGGIIYNAR